MLLLSLPFTFVGMAKVFTCDVTVKVGQRVVKGEELGMFHFGGSTHCLIFRPGVELEFDFQGQEPGLEAQRININSAIATVQ
jgi:phosphatidylserine decarboxylase